MRNDRVFETLGALVSLFLFAVLYATVYVAGTLVVLAIQACTPAPNLTWTVEVDEESVSEDELWEVFQ